MKITKIINNNVVSSIDSKGREIVVMGNGIGFKKKVGEEIDKERIEKKYQLSHELQGQFEQLIQDIPYEHLKLATLIIDETKDLLPREMSKTIYLTLTDHLSFAIERQKKGIAFSNPLSWEIRKFYPEEFAVGKRVVEIIREQTGISLPESEMASIALHFINAEVGGNIQDSMVMPEMVREIINIVTYSMLIDLDEGTVSYERFLTHLKYFVIRALRHEYYEEGDPALFENIKVAYPDEYQCAQRIKTYVEKKTDYKVSEEEVVYLAAHINRVKRRNK